MGEKTGPVVRAAKAPVVPVASAAADPVGATAGQTSDDRSEYLPFLPGRDGGPALSRDEYLSSLPEVKRNLLEAARRLFAQSGFHSLRLDAIAREAKENKAMIRYYFGDKDGLVSAVVESLIHDASLALVQQAEALPPGDERVHVYLEGAREIAEDSEQRTSLFDVLPEALREEEFRTQLADLYQWYRQINERCLGVRPEMPNYERLSALAMLVLAATDGLAIQAALDPDKVDIGPAFELLELVVAIGLKFLTPTDWNGRVPQG